MKAVYKPPLDNLISGWRRGCSFATEPVYIAAAAIVCLVLMPSLAAAQPIYPQGVDAHTRVISGISPGTDAGSCCWMAHRARISAAAPPGATAMIVSVFIPLYALPVGGTQALTVSIGSSPKRTVCCLGPGMHELAFALPRSSTTPFIVVLGASKTFVPARIGLGSDRRELSLLLRGIEWRDTASNAGLSAPIERPVARALFGLYALLFLVTLIVTWRRPIFGAALLIATSPFALYIPIDGTTLTLPKMFLLGVLIALVARRAGLKTLREPRLAALLIAQGIFAVVVLLSLHHAMVQAPVWREFFKQLQYGFTALAAFWAFRADQRADREGWIQGALLATTAVVAAAALTQERAGAPMAVYVAGHSLSRIAGPLEGPNQLGAFFGITLPVILAFALSRRRWRFLSCAALAFGGVAAILSFSRGGSVALVLALLLVLVSVAAPRFKRLAYQAAVVLFAAVFTIAVLQFCGVERFGLARLAFGVPSNGAEDFNGGLGTRAQLWHGAYALWRSSPLIGIGAGNYELEVASTGAPGVRTHANSVYFQTLAEEGLLGFIALAVLALISLRVVAVKSDSVLPTAMLAVMVALWFHQITDYVTFYPKVGVVVWAMLGIAVATGQLGNSERSM